MQAGEEPPVLVLTLSPHDEEWGYVKRLMPAGYVYDRTYFTDYGWIHVCRDQYGKRESIVLPALDVLVDKKEPKR